MVEPPEEDNPSCDCEGNSADAQDEVEAELNASLNEVLDLLALEVERLKTALEFYRLGDREDKDALIRWHIQQIDTRQDRLDELKSMIISAGEDSLH